MKIKFTVYGNPKGLKRHRDRKFGGKFDPSAGDKADFLAMAMQHKPDKPFPVDCPISLGVIAYFKRPGKHFYTGKRKDVMREDAADYYTNTPDGDNVLKFIGDALEGIFWENDKSIAHHDIWELYCNDNTPRIEVTIRTLI